MIHILTGVGVIQALTAIGVHNDLTIAAIAMMASVLIAAVTYRYVEVPARARFRLTIAPRAASKSLA
jgi:peptidoglycan/LPS O-acetylase OafA/YrhL